MQAKKYLKPVAISSLAIAAGMGATFIAAPAVAALAKKSIDDPVTRFGAAGLAAVVAIAAGSMLKGGKNATLGALAASGAVAAAIVPYVAPYADEYGAKLAAMLGGAPVASSSGARSLSAPRGYPQLPAAVGDLAADQWAFTQQIPNAV